MSDSIKFPRKHDEPSEPPMYLLPTWKMAGFQLVLTLLPIVGVFYQAFVVLPEIRQVRIDFETERVKEIDHAKKVDSLRKAAITERSLLLLDLKEARNLTKSIQSKGE